MTKKKHSSKDRIDKLCEKTSFAVRMVEEHKVLQLHNWRSLKLDIEKLKSLLDRLNRELARQRKGRY